MNKETYDEYISNYYLTQCAVGDYDNIAFGMKEEIDESDPALEDGPWPRDDETKARLLSYAPKRLLDQNGFGNIDWIQGVTDLHLAYDIDNLIIAGCNGEFFVWESTQEFQPVAEPEDDYTRGSYAAAFIDGNIYITGHLRKVFKRVGVNQWVDLTDEADHPDMFADLRALKKPGGGYPNAEAGFQAIAGFNSRDIYAGGSYGDLWHFDGSHWQRIDFPSSCAINSLCCAPDGFVYATCKHIGVFKGRGDRWQEIPNSGGPGYNSCAWFEGLLYLGCDYKLMVYDGSKLSRYQFPKDGPQQHSFKGVASSSDALVSFGPYQALLYDGQNWKEIVGRPELE